jgi:hypothetical protein
VIVVAAVLGSVCQVAQLDIVVDTASLKVVTPMEGHFHLLIVFEILVRVMLLRRRMENHPSVVDLDGEMTSDQRPALMGTAS